MRRRGCSQTRRIPGPFVDGLTAEKAFCVCRFPYNTSEFIVDRVARGLALFTNNATQAQMARRPYCDYAPSFVLANPGRFHYMLSRDPVTGSFSDYAEYLGDRTDVVGNFHGAWYGNDEKWHEE